MTTDHQRVGTFAPPGPPPGHRRDPARASSDAAVFATFWEEHSFTFTQPPGGHYYPFRVAVVVMSREIVSRILDAVRAQPGLTPKELAAAMGIKHRLALYYVHTLAAQGKLFAYRTGEKSTTRRSRFRLFHPQTPLPTHRHRELAALCRRRQHFEILFEALQAPRTTAQIARAVESKCSGPVHRARVRMALRSFEQARFLQPTDSRRWQPTSDALRILKDLTEAGIVPPRPDSRMSPAPRRREQLFEFSTVSS